MSLDVDFFSSESGILDLLCNPGDGLLTTDNSNFERQNSDGLLFPELDLVGCPLIYFELVYPMAFVLGRLLDSVVVSLLDFQSNSLGLKSSPWDECG